MRPSLPEGRSPSAHQSTGTDFWIWLGVMVMPWDMVIFIRRELYYAYLSTNSTLNISALPGLAPPSVDHVEWRIKRTHI